MTRGNPNGGSIVDGLGDNFGFCDPNDVALLVSSGMLMTDVRLSYNGSGHEAGENGSCVLHIGESIFVCFGKVKLCVSSMFGIELNPTMDLQLVP